LKERLIEILSCPVCGADLACTAEARDDGEIMEGELSCRGCDRVYRIREGVPQLLPGEENTVKEATARSFGYEWETYDRWGIDAKAGEDEERRLQLSHNAFARKALLQDGELQDKLVLDAGCGNGRYMLQALKEGAEVVGIDLSGAADVAFRNVGRHPRAHVVRGDLLRLPFRPGVFDRIFSIGVLMHTPDARGAFASVVSRLRPDGVISIHVYSRGNAVYETVDAALRRHTTQMDLEKLMRWSHRIEIVPKAVLASRWLTLGRPILYQLLNCVVRLEKGHHNIFDWYSAPVATHHTYGEVYRWFDEEGLKVTASHYRQKNPILRLLRSPAAGVTVKGRVARPAKPGAGERTHS
jgi:SAM-dependent methyltransferase